MNATNPRLIDSVSVDDRNILRSLHNKGYYETHYVFRGCTDLLDRYLHLEKLGLIEIVHGRRDAKYFPGDAHVGFGITKKGIDLIWAN